MSINAAPEFPGCKPILIVAGPTASGKSALALELARSLDGEIVNADSVQVYREADIGSAKPPKAERERVPHHLIDYCEPPAAFNTAAYVKAATDAITRIGARGKRAVVAGGSTLYITHLLHGVAELPAADPGLRAELEKLSTAELGERLKEIDPGSAERIHANDRLRLVRAIETGLLGGQPASDVLREHAYRDLRFSALILVVVRHREELYRRIAERTEAMLKSGLVDEVRTLMQKYGSSIKILKTLGYREAVDFIEGKLDKEELQGEISMNTRRYAKRQLTFWRNEPSKRCWSCRPSPDESHALIDAAEGPAGRKFKPIAAIECDAASLAGQVRSCLDSLSREVQVWYVSPSAA